MPADDHIDPGHFFRKQRIFVESLMGEGYDEIRFAAQGFYFTASGIDRGFGHQLRRPMKASPDEAEHGNADSFLAVDLFFQNEMRGQVRFAFASSEICGKKRPVDVGRKRTQVVARLAHLQHGDLGPGAPQSGKTHWFPAPSVPGAPYVGTTPPHSSDS